MLALRQADPACLIAIVSSRSRPTYRRNGFVHELLLQHIFARMRLTDRQVSLIESSFVPRKFKKGQFYQRAGEVTTHGGFVVAGCFRTCVTDGRAGRSPTLVTATGWDSSGRKPPNSAGSRCSCTHRARNVIGNS